MNLSPAFVALDKPFLTTADLQRIMGVGESTVLGWNKRKEIAFFRKGKVIRYTHSAVLEFVIRHTVKARGTDSHGNKLELCPLPAETFQVLCERVSRLVITQLNFGGALNCESVASTSPGQRKDKGRSPGQENRRSRLVNLDRAQEPPVPFEVAG